MFDCFCNKQIHILLLVVFTFGGKVPKVLYRGGYYLVNPILLKNDSAFQDRMNDTVVPHVLQQHASHVHAVPRRILHAYAPRPRGATLAAVGDETRDGDDVLPFVGHLRPVHGERSNLGFVIGGRGTIIAHYYSVTQGRVRRQVGEGAGGSASRTPPELLPQRLPQVLPRYFQRGHRSGEGQLPQHVPDGDVRSGPVQPVAAYEPPVDHGQRAAAVDSRLERPAHRVRDQIPPRRLPPSHRRHPRVEGPGEAGSSRRIRRR